jgi:hypothetical protein
LIPTGGLLVVVAKGDLPSQPILEFGGSDDIERIPVPRRTANTRIEGKVLSKRRPAADLGIQFFTNERGGLPLGSLRVASHLERDQSKPDSRRKTFRSISLWNPGLVIPSESVVLTLFVLISQNRMTRQAERRSHLDLQVGMLSEQELTRMLRRQHKICQPTSAN